MISVEHLTKWYGSNQAVKDLCFSIDAHGVYGFLGPNGAGKSTSLNMLTGCLSPTDGKITICGHDILEEPKQAKQCIGYLPELPPVYMQESPWEYLQFVGEAKGLKGKELESQILSVLARTGTISLTAKAEEEVLRALVSTLPELSIQKVEKAPDGYTTLTLTGGHGFDTTEKLSRRFAEESLPLAELRLNRADLEDVFLELAEQPEEPESEEEEA